MQLSGHGAEGLPTRQHRIAQRTSAAASCACPGGAPFLGGERCSPAACCGWAVGEAS